MKPLHSLSKQALEKGRASLAFFSGLFLVPKPDTKLRFILDLNSLNKFLKSEKFKIDTPESKETFLNG